MLQFFLRTRVVSTSGRELLVPKGYPKDVKTKEKVVG